MKTPYTTALRCALVFALLCGAVAQTQAFTINTTESRYEPGGIRYYFVVSDWTTNDQGRNPCLSANWGLDTCTVIVKASPAPGNSSSLGTGAWWKIGIRHTNSSTLGDLLISLKQQGFQIPFSGSVLVSLLNANNNNCITFTYAMSGPHLAGMFQDFGPCVRVATATMQCEIKGDTTIDHKRLPDNALNGMSASTQLDLQCRGPASVTVSASKTDALGVQLRSDGSLYAKVTVNGKDATNGINVAVSDGQSTKLNITSTLSAQGIVAPGEFSGFTVITVAPP